MKTTYPYAFRAVLQYEGGYTNDPVDPGGPTNLGVIQEEYDAWRAEHGRAQQSVRLITQLEASDIFKTKYWDYLGLDGLPAGVDFCIFDAAVNNGVFAAAKFAQRANNKVNSQKLTVDGVLGIMSKQYVSACPLTAFINAFCDERLRYDQAIKTWWKFGRGWTRRVESVRVQAVALASQAVGGIAPPPAPPAIKDQPIPRETSLWGWIVSLFGSNKNA